jgi:hypothetical protein
MSTSRNAVETDQGHADRRRVVGVVPAKMADWFGA